MNKISPNFKNVLWWRRLEWQRQTQRDKMSLYLNLKLWRAERMKMNEAPECGSEPCCPLYNSPFSTLLVAFPTVAPLWPARMQLGPVGSKPRYSPSAARSFLGQFRGPTLNSSLLPGSWCPSSPGLGWLGAQCRWREIGARGQSLTLFWIRGEKGDGKLAGEMDESGHSQFLNPCPWVPYYYRIDRLGRDETSVLNQKSSDIFWCPRQ